MTALPTQLAWNIVKVGVLMAFFLLSLRFVRLLDLLMLLGLPVHRTHLLSEGCFAGLHFPMETRPGIETQKSKKIILPLPAGYDVIDLFTFS